ncbi:hypothetical protein ONA91_33215 [Micromonospora sp. DR5-3]|uniref:hypothetical protein n=1 Tax=unclassified Micromonospora TaxID=2617518 RepID=UPI0011D8278E|nr:MULTISPECIES: hypothetical protein [unclassified Micromonospora]MCW3819313.1 hypothetical protein [Micromonospora sp. DR5-3]TYC21756.1 hypothetical protein FXF52_24085 [Micromonospora sp. MP36]
MKLIHRLIIAATALLGLWAGLAYQVSQPPAASGYARTVLQVAASAHDAATTGVLVARQQLRDHLTDAYTTTAYDDAVRAVAGAQQKLATAVAPDDASAALRDRLVPLVQDTVRDLSDAAAARDETTLGHAIDALGRTSRQLNDLVAELQANSRRDGPP